MGGYWQGVVVPEREKDVRRGDGGLASASLTRWVEAGLITREQAETIGVFEAKRGAVAAPAARRVPLVTEALGYLGAALALGAVVAFLGQKWGEFTRGAHIGILGGGVVLLLIAGWLLRRTDEPAFGRLMSVLWFLSAGLAAATFALLVPENTADERRTLLTGIGTSAYAGALWLFRRWALQLLACFGGVVTLVVGVIATGWGHPPVWVFGFAVWGLGAVLLLLGWLGPAKPAFAAYVIGSCALIVGPRVSEQDWMLFLGLATGAALMAVSVAAREAVLLGFGAAAVFGYVTWIAVRFFGDTLGAPLALLVAGIVLLGVAVLTARLRRLTGRREPAAPSS